MIRGPIHARLNKGQIRGTDILYSQSRRAKLILIISIISKFVTAPETNCTGFPMSFATETLQIMENLALCQHVHSIPRNACYHRVLWSASYLAYIFLHMNLRKRGA